MLKDLTSLEGKLIVVTGAGVGIGRSVALEAARRGADVALHFSSSDQGAKDAAEQIAAMGRRVTTVQGDLSRVDECRRVIDEAVAFLGGLDALVSNAGVSPSDDFQDVTEEQFNHVFNVNIRGQYFCAQQAVKHMVDRGRELSKLSPDRPWRGGCIVNISSVHAAVGFPGFTAYAGTKGAINAFGRALSIELMPHHIRVNTVAPGAIEVPRYWKIIPDYDREVGNSMVPWGRIGLPEDIAYTVVFLISDAAEFITGQVIYVDGGLTAKMAMSVNYNPDKGQNDPGLGGTSH
jgi:NAD(P)-dependent dehydrogenase (short-subunit alcohol dehydrogenase family)